MFAVVVKFQIKPDQLEAFMPMMLANAHASLRDEEGCHQFDVCTDSARAGEVFLYELYTDAEAFEVHKTMPHFLIFDEESAPMITEKIVHTYGVVAQ